MGIGPEISLRALQSHTTNRNIILLGRRSSLQEASEQTGIELDLIEVN